MWASAVHVDRIKDWFTARKEYRFYRVQSRYVAE